MRAQRDRQSASPGYRSGLRGQRSAAVALAVNQRLVKRRRDENSGQAGLNFLGGAEVELGRLAKFVHALFFEKLRAGSIHF